MPRRLANSWWIGYAAALAMVALVGMFIGLFIGRAAISNVSMLYLIAVLTSATVFGSGPAILASVAAFLTFNWFFIEPLHTLTIADPEEWVALLLFLLTAIITGQLAAGQRRRAQQAEQREREAVVLYDVVRLVGELDLREALQAVAGRLRDELELAAVGIDLDVGDSRAVRVTAGDSSLLSAAARPSSRPAEMLTEGAVPTGTLRGAPGRWVHIVPPGLRERRADSRARHLHVVPIKSRDKRAGVISLVHSSDAPEFSLADDRLLSAVASQLGQAMERDRLRHEATEAEVLRRTDELKTTLLNAVSHDLRTPIASIVASAGALLQRDVVWSEEERRGFAQAIEQESRRLNQLVGNLLDLSRIQAGSLSLEKGWYDLGVLVDEVLGRLRPLTTRHRITVDIPEDLPPVLLGYVEIDQVISNLVENAAKYAPPETEIRVSARRVGHEVQVEVADRGPGVPPSDLPRLFEPFHRVRREGQYPRGVGLGLAVARGLVEAHGGRIWAENRPGGGTRFVFTLPLPTDRDGWGKEQAG